MTKHSKKNTVFLVGFWPDYETFFFEESYIAKCKIKVINPKYICYKNRLFSLLPRKLKNKQYIKLINNLVNDNLDGIFIFQDFRILIEYLIQTERPIKACLLLRNSIHSKSGMVAYIRKLQEKKIPIWSFDQEDCINYDLYFYDQFIHKYPAVQNILPQYDFSFIGRDKGRVTFLNKLSVEIKNLDLSINIKVLDKKKDIVSYFEYINYECNSRCFIDIVQSNQSGLTLRPLEATIYKRKLITNNSFIKDSPIFNPNNILIFNNKINPKELEEFMQLPLVAISHEILSQYSAARVLDKICTYFIQNEN